MQSKRIFFLRSFLLLAIPLLTIHILIRGGRLSQIWGRHYTHYLIIDRPDSVDWSRFAYVQYVTNLPYLCNSVMLFESLHRLGCRPDRLLMYPSHFALDGDTPEASLLRKARDEYGAILRPIEVQWRSSDDCKSFD